MTATMCHILLMWNITRMLVWIEHTDVRDCKMGVSVFKQCKVWIDLGSDPLELLPLQSPDPGAGVTTDNWLVSPSLRVVTTPHCPMFTAPLPALYCLTVASCLYRTQAGLRNQEQDHCTGLAWVTLQQLVCWPGPGYYCSKFGQQQFSKSMTAQNWIQT